jgi:hypothetical protein
MKYQPTQDQQEASAQAADLLDSQADGLRKTGSVNTVSAFADYVATLRKIAASPEMNLTAKEKIDVEQATFVLEGQRDGLLTADFKDRADKIQTLIRSLNDIVERYNAGGAE